MGEGQYYPGQNKAAEISNRSAYELAQIADCGAPDTLESPGARVLTHVAGEVFTAFTEDRLTEPDLADEIAGSAPDVYSHKLWLEFTDLCAYQELAALREDGLLTLIPEQADTLAHAALEAIARRLADALIAELSEAIEADEDRAEELSDLA